MTDVAHPELEGLGTYEYGWHDPDAAGATAQRGLSEAVVRDISAKKNEPEWMLDLRLKGLRLFDKKPMPASAASSGRMSTTSNGVRMAWARNSAGVLAVTG